MGALDISSLKAAFESASANSELSTLAVAAGVFIELGALFWFSKGMPPLEKRLMVLATALIAAGCAGEYIFGARATAAASQLQQASDQIVATLTKEAEAERLARVQLEAKIAPRTLTAEQAAKVKSAISRFAGMHFDLAVENDIEPMRLLDSIEDVLLGAGWKEQPIPAAWETFHRMGRSPVGVKTVAGVWVIYSQQSIGSFKDAATTLANSLRGQGITTSLIEDVGPTPDENLVIDVWVGGKP